MKQRAKYTIGDLQEWAQKRNGELLSTEYKTANTKYLWRCKEHNYEWVRSWAHIREGRWCRMCSKVRTYTIEDLKNYALERGGACLSDEYRGILEKYLWRCGQCDYEWQTSFVHMAHKNTWCRKCSSKAAGQKRRQNTNSIEDLKAFAKKNNGQLLSTEYIGTKDKYRWYCNVHKAEWLARWEKVKHGRWCPQCGRDKASEFHSYSLKDMHDLAEKYHGKFLDNQYKGISHKHRWRCANGHEFFRAPALLTKSNPLQNVWCTQCKSRNHAEDFCRAVFVEAFGKNFENGYFFDWLVNSRKKKMQLDGYSSELNLAFEYQGEQHAEESWFSTKGQLKQRIIDDRRKEELCRVNGVTLVQIPPFGPLHKTDVESLVDHVLGAIQSATKYTPTVEVKDVVERYHSFKRNVLTEIKKDLYARDIELLSPEFYAGMNSKASFNCKVCEWSWTTTLSSVVIQKTGCANCKGGAPKDIRFLHAIAEAKGFECLSTTYKTSKTAYEWRCKRCSRIWSCHYGNLVDRYSKGKLIKGSACECGQNGPTADALKGWYRKP